MKLYHISQTEARGYDTFSDMVVCAESEEEARNIHPRGEWDNSIFGDNTWCRSPESVTVKYLGEAHEDLKKSIICSSFHAG